MLITCKHCKETVDVPMYFYDHLIQTKVYYMTPVEEYTAVVKGKATCPCCGSGINEVFASIISNKDIVRLAIGKENNK